MSIVNVVIVVLLAALVAWAVWRAVGRARKGSACCGGRAAPERRVAVADRNRAHYPYEITLEIGGMTCENCARRVENALNALEGTWAKVDIDSRTARVRCKAQPNPAALADAVRRAGYAVVGTRT